MSYTEPVLTREFTLESLSTQSEKSLAKKIIESVTQISQRISNKSVEDRAIDYPYLTLISQTSGLTLHTIKYVVEYLEKTQLDFTVKKITKILLDNYLNLRKIQVEKRQIKSVFWAYFMTDKVPLEVLADLIGKLDTIHPEDYLTLLTKVIQKGPKEAIVVANNFDRLNFQILHGEHRLAMAKKIVKMGTLASFSFVENSRKFCLQKTSILSRVRLARLIIKKLALKVFHFTELFESLGFVEAFAKCKCGKERIELATSLINWGGEHFAFSLAWHFDVITKVETTKDERYCMAEKIVEAGTFASYTVAFYLEQIRSLGSKKIGALAEKIVDKGGVSAIALTRVLDILQLEEHQLFSLSKCIMRQGQEPTVELLKNCSFFSELTVFSQMKLLKCFVKKGERVLITLFQFLEKFNIAEFSLKSLIRLAKKIIRQGEEAAFTLCKNFSELRLDQANLEDRLILAKHIISQGERVAQAFLKNLSLFSLESARSDQLSGLVQDLFSQVNKAMHQSCLYYFKSSCNNVYWQRAIVEQLVTHRYLRFDPSDLHLPCELKNVTKFLMKDTLSDSAIRNFERFWQSKKELYQVKMLYEIMKREIKNRPDFLHLVKWLGFTSLMLSILKEREAFVINNTGLLETIYHLQSPKHRYLFIKLLGYIAEQQISSIDYFTQHLVNLHSFAKLAWILLFRMTYFGLKREKALQICQAVHRRKHYFKGTKHFINLLQLLENLLEKAPFKAVECEKIGQALTYIFTCCTQKEMTLNLQCLHNVLCLFGRSAFFTCLQQASPNYERFLVGRFVQVFPVKLTEDFNERYQTYFEGFRDKKILFSYLASVKKLSSLSRKKVLKSLHFFVNSIFKNAFPKVRYETDRQDYRHEHLETIFSYRENLKELWLQRVSYKKISETDAPYDLLALGTEIHGSCLSIQGLPELNKCLMGYVLNGEVRPLVARDHEGKIIARALLRLMWDTVNECPVLFLERTLSNIRNPSLKENIKTAAIMKAKLLGVTLVCEEVGTGILYRGSVEFLGGGIAPFTYCDLAEGVQESKKAFRIRRNCYVLYEAEVSHIPAKVGGM